LLDERALGTPTGRIVRALSERGGLSATQLASLTGLAKSTVSMTLGELRKSGMVVESAAPGAARSNGVGRPATMLTLNPEAGTCVGVLIGLGYIQVIVADVSHAVIASREATLDHDYSPQEAVDVVRALMEESYAEHSLSPAGLLGVGIAIAGPVNPIERRGRRGSVGPIWARVDRTSALSW